MPAKLYEVLSLGMRYWFVLLGVAIVLYSYLWLMRDRHARSKRLRQLPDAGMIGELLVLRGSPELPDGSLLPLPYEGTLGFVRSADVTVPCNAVAAQHLDFSFQPRLGLLIYPRRGVTCLADGVPMNSRSHARQTPLRHNSILTVGEAELQVRLFAGLDTMPPTQKAGAVSHPTADGKQHKHVAEPAPKPPVMQQPTLFGQPLTDDAPPSSTERRRRRAEKEKTPQK